MYGRNGRLVIRPEFPSMPPECPPDYSQLVAECINHEHRLRPTFEDINGLLVRIEGRMAHAR